MLSSVRYLASPIRFKVDTRKYIYRILLGSIPLSNLAMFWHVQHYYGDDSETDSWYELYKERYFLELNWKNHKCISHTLSGSSNVIHCLYFLKAGL